MAQRQTRRIADREVKGSKRIGRDWEGQENKDTLQRKLSKTTPPNIEL